MVGSLFCNNGKYSLNMQHSLLAEQLHRLLTQGVQQLLLHCNVILDDKLAHR